MAATNDGVLTPAATDLTPAAPVDDAPLMQGLENARRPAGDYAAVPRQKEEDMADTTTETKPGTRHPVGWIGVVAVAAILANSVSTLVSAPPTSTTPIESSMVDPNFGP